MNTKKIAILGLGAMGSRMAQNLLKANYQVIVYNRTADKATPLVKQGAIYAATPRTAAEQADIVISMVTDDAASRTTWLDAETGAIAGLNPTAIAIESSTLTVDWTKELATAVNRQGAMFLDAPVVGSRPQVEAGKLVYLVGGEAETLAEVKETLLAASGATIHLVGSVGQGMAMKLAVNALFGAQVAALAEMIGVLTRQGMTAETALACLSELPVLSPAAKLAGQLMLADNHAPLFPIALVEKDFRYMTQTAAAVAAPTPVASAIRVLYQDAIAQGYGNDNITGIVRLFGFGEL
jgi:3-hydroxyisobutyrate dehydrogenase-like beta-hydroxyacid dehydrogenase